MTWRATILTIFPETFPGPLGLSLAGKALAEGKWALATIDIRDFAAGPGLVIVCGRFEGVDERVIEGRGLQEVSIGDYVLSGGELAALVLIDACVRLLPGVAGNEVSLADESFAGGLLEYPHYTRPRDWEGRPIPEVLLSGDHDKIAEWRREQAEKITKERRPDLLSGRKP